MNPFRPLTATVITIYELTSDGKPKIVQNLGGTGINAGLIRQTITFKDDRGSQNYYNYFVKTAEELATLTTAVRKFGAIFYSDRAPNPTDGYQLQALY